MKSRALLAVFAVSQLTCHQALFVAPPGSSIQCFSNPTSVPASRGVSVISCLLMDGTGNPVADGTVAQFFTDLGRIPEQGRTNDGVVRVNFESDGRSGTATITVVSGGEATGGGTTTTTTQPVQRGFSASGGQVTAALSGIAVQTTTTVRVGNASVAGDILLVSNTSRITDTRPAELTANVTDEVGNPIARVPVFFTVTAGGGGAAPAESLDSQGQPVLTDTNGQARDVLRTRAPRDSGSRTVEVIARVAGAASNPVTIIVN